jgi:diguanylate cyclase (GGDEF)-like protein
MVTNSNDSLARKVDFFQEYRIIRADGELRHLRSKATYLEDHNGSGPNILGVNIDITDDVEKSVVLEKARAAMELEGRHNPLTGLANRRKLDQAHATIISDATANSKDPTFAVLNLDLNMFKEINDTLGHAAGDIVLIHAGALIRDIVGDKGLVARAGGEGFIARIEGDHSVDPLNNIAHQIISATQTPCYLDGKPCSFSMRIGIARHAPKQSNLAGAFMSADLALYQAKQDGLNCARHFETPMRVDCHSETSQQGWKTTNLPMRTNLSSAQKVRRLLV